MKEGHVTTFTTTCLLLHMRSCFRRTLKHVMRRRLWDQFDIDQWSRPRRDVPARKSDCCSSTSVQKQLLFVVFTPRTDWGGTHNTDVSLNRGSLLSQPGRIQSRQRLYERPAGEERAVDICPAESRGGIRVSLTSRPSVCGAVSLSRLHRGQKVPEAAGMKLELTGRWGLFPVSSTSLQLSPQRHTHISKNMLTDVPHLA